MKKCLYKENPKAGFFLLKKGVAWYKAECSLGSVIFSIPLSDMGDASFEAEMEAKYLIRWICEST